MKRKWIIRVMQVILILVVMVSVVGCHALNDFNNTVIPKLVDEKPRMVFLYDNNGNLIDTWDGIFRVEKVGDMVSLIGSNGSLYISGGIVVVEED